ncbi:MAG: hypothetical protein U0003_02090 [Vampirovibrionales bacterium]
MNNDEPQRAARLFFHSLMQNQCHLSWKLFSKKSQDVFLKWTIEDIYARNKQAAEFAKLGLTEVRLMFENNDTGIMKSFWKRFFFASNAGNLYRFGYFNLGKEEAHRAVVEVLMKFPDGRTATTPLMMFKEKGSWKLGYVESGLPF